MLMISDSTARAEVVTCFWFPIVDSLGAIRVHQFFHGWPRKAGCIVLLIAMALMGCWVRSRVVRDWLTITFRGEVHDVISFNGRIHWWASAINLNKRTSIERTCVFNETQIRQHMLTMRVWRAWMEQSQGREWIIPYWSIVLLATMVSGSLLFWKPFPVRRPGRVPIMAK